MTPSHRSCCRPVQYFVLNFNLCPYSRVSSNLRVVLSFPRLCDVMVSGSEGWRELVGSVRVCCHLPWDRRQLVDTALYHLTGMGDLLPPVCSAAECVFTGMSPLFSFLFSSLLSSSPPLLLSSSPPSLSILFLFLLLSPPPPRVWE